MRITIKKIKSKLAKNRPLLSNNEKELTCLPKDGYKVSVETALNSRCCSDYDDDPELFHWGMFDSAKKLPEETIGTLADLARCCRLARYKTEIQMTNNMLTFLVDGHFSGIQKKWAMVESGMQQQACALACASSGAGMVFKSMGDNGTLLSPDQLAAARIMIDAMKPSYDGSYWSNQPPAGRKPWLPGNLPDPAREGDTPLLQILASLPINHHGCRSLTDKKIGQLLWAARGRTPHLYKSRPWGMTIPASRGDQDISRVYLLKQRELSHYINQLKKRPTHSLQLCRRISDDAESRLFSLLPRHEQTIILTANESSGRACWEIGYQLLNILVQAYALDLDYCAIFLDDGQGEIGNILGVSPPIAAVGLT
jgi:hypothetical protein